MDRVRKPRVYMRESPMLLILHEKHDTSYYHIPDELSLFVVALKVLTDRFNSGYWYYKPDLSKCYYDKGVHTQADVDKIENAAVKEEASKFLKAYLRERRDKEEDLDQYERMEKAIQDKNGRAAWEILYDERSDGEYERVELASYSTLVIEITRNERALASSFVKHRLPGCLRVISSSLS